MIVTQVAAFVETSKQNNYGADTMMWNKFDARATNQHFGVRGCHEHILVLYADASSASRPREQHNFRRWPQFATSLEKVLYAFDDRIPRCVKVRVAICASHRWDEAHYLVDLLY
jgi:hypothetical protein